GQSLLQLLLEGGRRQVAEAITGCVDVSNITGQHGVPRLGEVEHLAQSRNGCRAKQILQHGYQTPSSRPAPAFARAVPLAICRSRLPLAGARQTSTNSAAGGNWAKSSDDPRFCWVPGALRITAEGPAEIAEVDRQALPNAG